jgi:hypothetical protein
MSEIFIAQFVMAHKCAWCKGTAKDGYSVCSKHLKQAKMKWRKWQVVRRKEKKCCYCDGPSFMGYLRCETHTKINKANCKAWGKKHYHEHREVYEKPRFAAFEALGRCPVCKPHRKTEIGHKRCWVCSKRKHLKSYRGISTPINITEAKLKSLLKLHGLGVE